MGLTVRAAALLLTMLLSACGHEPSGRSRDLRALLLAFDDNRPSAMLAFPTLTYESLVRFTLPAGSHRPWRLWFMAAAAGTVTISLYKNTLLEAPGDPFDTFTREILPQEVSNGKDGRWLVEDLQDLDTIDGVIWVGVRKVGGDPALWTSSTPGQTFLRDRDLSRGVGILPVKRTPLLRLELAPEDLPRTPTPAPQPNPTPAKS